MKKQRILALNFAFAIAALWVWFTPGEAMAQSAETSLKQSCGDARRAFALRQSGIENLAVADPAATSQLRQAALLFYRCGQHEPDPYMHEMFLAYYANTLFKLGQNIGDSRATSLAMRTAQPLMSSEFDEVRALLAIINVASPRPSTPAPTPVPTAAPRSAAYCSELVPNVGRALNALGLATIAANDAGKNDTQVLVSTTARYGSAYKAVEDDFNNVQSNLQGARSALADANDATSALNDQERAAATRTLQAIQQTIDYADTYSRLALGFERGVNGANRRLAWARASEALASGMRNTSYTYSNGNASCYSYTSYSTNCSGSSYSTTSYDNSASLAQQNAANAMADARAGRLSYSAAASVLIQGLPVLQQIQNAVYDAQASWNKACT